MKTVRTALQWMSLPVLALCLLAQPALAQKDAIVTIEKTDGGDTVVVKIEDGNRTVTVNGKVLDDEEAEKYLEEMGVFWVGDDEGYAWRFGPRSNRFHFFGDDDSEFMADFEKRLKEGIPHVYFRDSDDARENVFFLDDQLRGLRDGLAAFGKDGNGFAFGLDTSMKERAEIAQMDMESRRLAMKIREADEADRAGLERELQDLLADIFDRKMALREERIDALREQLGEAEEARQERQQNRQEIIERRLKELLGERDKYDW